MCTLSVLHMHNILPYSFDQTPRLLFFLTVRFCAVTIQGWLLFSGDVCFFGKPADINQQLSNVVSDYCISPRSARYASCQYKSIPVDLSTVILMYYAMMVAEVRKKYANNT